MNNDNGVLIIEVPNLTDDAALQLLDFLHQFMLAFESRYYHQLQRAYQQQSPDERLYPNLSDDDNPF